MTYPVRLGATAYYGYGDEHTVDIPSGGSGQTLLLFIGSDGNPTMSTAPSGFTLANSWTDGTSAKVFLYYRTTDGNEGSTVSFTLDADHDVSCRLLRFRNLRSGSLSDWLEVDVQDSSNSTELYVPGFTTANWSTSGDEYFRALGYAFVVGTVTIDSYPYNLTEGRDWDSRTGTGEDVGDGICEDSGSLYGEFPYGSWYFNDSTFTGLSVSVLLRGDTLDIVNQDFSSEYNMGGWVRSDEYTAYWNYPEQVVTTIDPLWNYPEQATSSLSATYQVAEATVGGTVSADLAAQYDIIAAVGQNLSAEWNYPEQPTSLFTGEYQLLLAVSSDLVAEFKTGLDPVGNNRVVEYAVCNLVGQSKSFAYDVDSVLPSIAARGYVVINSQSSPVDEQIPIPAGRVGDVVFITYAGGSPYLKTVFDLIRGYVRDLELDGQYVSRVMAGSSDEQGWYYRLAGGEPSFVVLPAEHQYSNDTYKFFVFVLRNIFPYTPSLDDYKKWVDIFSESDYGSGSPVRFQLPNAYLWHSGYSSNDWTNDHYYLQVATLFGATDAPTLSANTLGYPTPFARDRASGDQWATASTVTVDYPPSYYASYLPIPPDYPDNPNAQYFEAPEWTGTTQSTLLFVFRGVDAVRSDLSVTYTVYETVGSDFSPSWSSNPYHRFGFDVQYGFRLSSSFVVDYRIDEKSIAAFDVTYALPPTIRVGFEVSFAGAVGTGFDVGSVLGFKPQLGFELGYALGSSLAVAFDVAYSDAVASAFDVGSSLQFYRTAIFDASYALYANVASGFDVAYSDVVASAFEVSSALWFDRTLEFGSSYALYTNVSVSFDVAYSDKVSSEFAVGSSLSFRRVVAFDLPYALTQPCISSFDAHWSLKSISMSFEVASSLIAKVQKSVDVVSALIARIVKDVDVGFAIEDMDRVQMAFGFGYFYSDDSVVLAPTIPFVSVDGRTLDVVSVEVAADEDGDVWEASFEIGNLQDFGTFSVNKELSLFFCGEEYRLIVDSRAIDRSNPEQVVATIYGVSPAKAYQTPRAESITKTWTEATLASEIAVELIPALQWETLDWVVGAGLFGLEESSPLDGVKALAKVVGAVFESLPDGTMRVRPRYPISVPNFGEATASFTVTDRVDNFSYSEKYAPNRLENLITITDEQDDNKDRVEFIVDEYDSERGVIRVYPAVWRESVSIRPTGSIRSYVYDGVVTREEEEEVEFVNGVASTTYPIVDIVSAVWNTTNLGSVDFKFYQQELTCSVTSDAYSLLKIKYITQTHNFSIVGTYNTSVQFVVENV